MSGGAFTPEQEARLREMVREELAALRVALPGFPSWPAEVDAPHDFNDKADEFTRALNPWGDVKAARQ